MTKDKEVQLRHGRTAHLYVEYTTKWVDEGIGPYYFWGERNVDTSLVKIVDEITLLSATIWDDTQTPTREWNDGDPISDELLQELWYETEDFRVEIQEEVC